MQSSTDQAIESCLQKAAAAADDERRKQQRYPFFRAVSLSTASGDGMDTVAFSRDISPGGIGLLHDTCLDTSELIVQVPLKMGRQLRVATQIKWCAPAGGGWFFSGGSFVGLSVRQAASLLFATLGGELSRRLQQRHPFFRPVTITPAGANKPSLSGFSRDISPGGIGLLHNAPLENGRVILQDSASADRQLDISVDVTWCAPVGEGFYISGGQFVRLMLEEAPLRFL